MIEFLRSLGNFFLLLTGMAIAFYVLYFIILGVRLERSPIPQQDKELEK